MSQKNKSSGTGWRRFERCIGGYVAKYMVLWDNAEPVTPRGRRYSGFEKRHHEAEMLQQVTSIKRKLRRFPRSLEHRGTWREDMLLKARELARGTLGAPAGGLRRFFAKAGLEATSEFISEARAFDPDLPEPSLFQALRNLWVIQSIQLLLNQQMMLSRAAFAYCMLYPWTDNYLDDPEVSVPRKMEFCEWLGRRLCRANVSPRTNHADQVDQLISLIESVFPRQEFEEVYFSLRAIHEGQVRSLAQQGGDGSLDDRTLLRLTIQKGGSSVLANAYLVVGDLSEEQADFMFGYGVLLQLLDDLQDLQDDLLNSHTTLFTREFGRNPLDGLAKKLWSFSRALLWGPNSPAMPRSRAVRNFIHWNCKRLLFQACAGNSSGYSPAFLADLEAVSPYRFSFMRARESRAKTEVQKIISSLRAQARVNSVFDLVCTRDHAI